MTVLHTARLRLEPVADHHYAGIRLLNSDPEVMRYIGPGIAETEEGTLAMMARVKDRWAVFGYSWWCVIETGSDELVGMACVQHLERDASQPHEIGWRLRPAYWGKGYASEAAAEIVRFAFAQIKVPVLYAIAHPENLASQRVMQKLGMQHVGIRTFYGKAVTTFILPNPAQV